MVDVAEVGICRKKVFEPTDLFATSAELLPVVAKRTSHRMLDSCEQAATVRRIPDLQRLHLTL